MKLYLTYMLRKREPLIALGSHQGSPLISGSALPAAGWGYILNTLALRRWSQTAQSSCTTRAVSRRAYSTTYPQGDIQMKEKQNVVCQKRKQVHFLNTETNNTPMSFSLRKKLLRHQYNNNQLNDSNVTRRRTITVKIKTQRAQEVTSKE